MRALLILVLFATAGQQQASRYVDVKGVTLPVNVTAESLVGDWYRGDGLGYNVTLSLKAKGNFEAVWTGCVGEYGRAEGTWIIDQGAVALKPVTEAGTMVNYLRRVDIVSYRGHVLLVPSGKDGDFFVEYGPSNYSCFGRDDNLPMRRERKGHGKSRGS